MDFDTTSNVSQISNQSDDVKSTVSSISGLSNYQDEFVELRHLVNPEKYPATREQTSTPINDSGCDLHYEDRIADLSYQLQSTLKQNEHYKNDLYKLEMKFEVKYHANIEKLLKTNNKLEIELSNANEQIQRLIRNYAGKNESKSKQENSFIVLEKKYHDLALENSNIEKKYFENNRKNKELDHLNQKLRIDLNDSRLEIETKNVCIKQLKEKIAQQFVEIQILTKSKNLSSQSINEKNIELEQVKKVLVWYKTQLEIVQNETNRYVKDISNYKLELLTKTEKIQTFGLEIKLWENKFELYQLEVSKEKAKVYQELQQKKLPLEEENNKTKKFDLKVDNSILNYYEDNMEDLKKEISSIRNYMREQDEIIKRINKENSDLVSKCVTTQKLLQNKYIELEDTCKSKSQLASELSQLKDYQVGKNVEIDSLLNEKNKLEIEILSCKAEKEMVDISIETIRNQFATFLSQYNQLKEELLKKNKLILNLQNEKQELFMNNNWKVCELEESKNKDLQIVKLKEDINAKKQIIYESLGKIKSFETDLKSRDEKINKLEEDHGKEIQRYDQVLMEYKKMVDEYQTKIKNLEATVTTTKLLTKDLKDNLNIFKNELNNRDLELSELAQTNQNLLKQIEENMHRKTSTHQVDQETMTDAKFSLETKNCHKIEQVDQTEENFGHQKVTECQKVKLDSNIKGKFFKLRTRVKNLECTVLECKKHLNSIVIENKVSEKNKCDLNALLQVKELELKEKQRKYERIYRTLLRKVREHMKGRSTAEKHNKYLQDLYNITCNENNSLKLTLSSKDIENEANKTLLKDFRNINEKLKKELLELDKRVKRSEMCMKCVEFEAVKAKLGTLETFIDDITNEKQALQNLVIGKESLVLDLKHMTQELQCQISLLTTEKQTHISKIEEIQFEQNKFSTQNDLFLKQLQDSELIIGNLNGDLETERHLKEEKDKEIFTLKNNLRDIEGRLECVTKDKETLNASLSALTEELQFLIVESNKKDDFLNKQCDEFQNTFETLKNRLQETHRELSAVNSEKCFIQRLCNDLKVALKSYVNQNQILKNKLDLLYENRRHSISQSSLPNFPSVQNFNEQSINNLLEETQVIPTGRSLTDIQLSLDSLRKEIFIIKDQISKKNFHTGYKSK